MPPSTLRHAARLSSHGVRAVSSSGTSAWNPIIRVGMPLASGRLTRYGIDSELPLMFSANAFARVDARHCFRGFNLKAAAAIPAHVDCALDSAGFVAAAHFGDYRWDIDAYLDLAAARAWTFYSAMDYCVEPRIATNAATRRLRIEATVARYFQCEHRAAPRDAACLLLLLLLLLYPSFKATPPMNMRTAPARSHWERGLAWWAWDLCADGICTARTAC